VPGQLIFPERFPASVVASEKRVLGQVGYAGQHQQRPVPREGGMFKADRVEVMESAPAGLKMCRGWDQAASSGRGDYTVGALLGKDTDGAWWIVDIVRQQTDEPRALLKQAAATDGKSVPISWPQDPGAAGKDQAKSLTSDMAGYTFHTSPETGAKETRWEPFSSQVNGRNVKMVRAPWNRALLEEMQTAPRGANDDMLDALARAFSYLTNQRSGLIDYYASAG
jgi:predicted phage terminase large subunit-like protein